MARCFCVSGCVCVVSLMLVYGTIYPNKSLLNAYLFCVYIYISFGAFAKTTIQRDRASTKNLVKKVIF